MSTKQNVALGMLKSKVHAIQHVLKDVKMESVLLQKLAPASQDLAESLARLWAVLMASGVQGVAILVAVTMEGSVTR